MNSPWKSRGPMQPDRSHVVLASSIPPRRRSSTRALFAGAGAVRKQLCAETILAGFDAPPAE